MKRQLLDTHIVLRGLTPATHAILENEAVHGSALSVWELLLKQRQGRLRLPDSPSIAAIERAGATLIPLLAEHAESTAAMGHLHGDPIDRLLVGTAHVEQMVLMTRDAELLERAVPVLGKLLLEA